MTKVTLEYAYEILENCAAIKWEDRKGYKGVNTFLEEPLMLGLNNKEPDHKWLYIDIADGRDEIECYENNNLEVKIDGSTMFLYDKHGRLIQLTILASDDTLESRALLAGGRFEGA